MRWLMTGSCLYAAMVLQAGLGAQPLPAGLIPNLLLLVAVLNSLDREPPAGLLTAALAGLLTDGLSSDPLGTGLFTFTIIAAILQASLPESRPLAAGLIAFATFLATIVHALTALVTAAMTASNSLATEQLAAVFDTDRWLAMGSRAGLTAGLAFVLLILARTLLRTSAIRSRHGAATITNRWSMLAD